MLYSDSIINITATSMVRPKFDADHVLSLSFVQELGRSLAMSADSTGVQAPVELAPEISALRLGLRDTLVRGWLSGVQGLSDDAPPSAEQYDQPLNIETITPLQLAMSGLLM